MNKLQLLQLSKSVPIDLIHLKKNGFFLFSITSLIALMHYQPAKLQKNLETPTSLIMKSYNLMNILRFHKTKPIRKLMATKTSA